MTKKKIYIAGCGGMLGEAFYKQFSEEYELKCTDIDVNENWLSYLDFRDFDSYKEDVTYFSPDYLFHLGAFTDLEFCELHQDEASITNTRSVENAVYIHRHLLGSGSAGYHLFAFPVAGITPPDHAQTGACGSAYVRRMVIAMSTVFLKKSFIMVQIQDLTQPFQLWHLIRGIRSEYMPVQV